MKAGVHRRSAAFDRVGCEELADHKGGAAHPRRLLIDLPAEQTGTYAVTSRYTCPSTDPGRPAGERSSTPSNTASGSSLTSRSRSAVREVGT